MVLSCPNGKRRHIMPEHNSQTYISTLRKSFREAELKEIEVAFELFNRHFEKLQRVFSSNTVQQQPPPPPPPPPPRRQQQEQQQPSQQGDCLSINL
ncbi:Hypothetical predicted protein [Octopus vulgaris]|uniref:Uncharacterized protein n=1 Tax=Octopus vulgaris TaxID=6645 RepID=A0AA36AHP4_OCTVU|nr:Hypothetical predicted protein [Octopus vulgaris]